jgi:tripartite-type tricarboxylate transporter receptor subunit TctC
MQPIKTLITIACLAALPIAAMAQTYPSKAITIVNPYAVGGPADQLARVLAKGMGEQLGQPVIVENKAGGGASIGAAFVAKSPNDGYTLLFGTSASHVVTPAATNVPYDGIQDFDFIGIVANVPNMLTIHPSIKVNNLKEFIAIAKSQPGKLSYVSAGLGSSPHIGMEMFKYMTGTFLVHIPYRGAAPASSDLVAGTVPVGMLNISGVQGFIKTNRLRALAYGGNKRSANFPDVPTFAEAGIPNFISGSWYSLAAPAKTSTPVLDRLTKAMTAVLASPEFVSAATQQSAEIYNFTRAQTRAFVLDDAKSMNELIKATGMKVID